MKGAALMVHERVRVTAPGVVINYHVGAIDGVCVDAGPNVVNSALTTCPRCGQMLVDEGFAYYCRYGCTRMFPKLGARLSERYRRARFGAMAQHPLDGLYGSPYKDGISSVWKSSSQREKQRGYNRRARRKQRARAT